MRRLTIVPCPDRKYATRTVRFGKTALSVYKLSRKRHARDPSSTSCIPVRA